MKNQIIYASLTRISNLKESGFSISPLPKSNWANADYVAVEVTEPGNGAKIELTDGRQMDPLTGETLIGALGVRHATLEATGSWEYATPDEDMELLTAAGLIGKMTSLSPLCLSPIKVRYIGHVIINERKTNMADYVPDFDIQELNIPIVLLTGTSMSAGKTTVARIITRELTNMGLKVLGVKLTGAGRYRDILAIQDAGAVEVLDFVDAGLPSSICDVDKYNEALDFMISKMAKSEADVAVVEIGASPYEPYNGIVAIEKISTLIRYKVICTTDPYAAYGVIRGFDFFPDLVSGPCTNTISSIELVEKLTSIEALNLLNAENTPLLRKRLEERLA